MFMHCLNVSFIGAYQVFDKMPKWHFGVVLDSNEYQILGLTWLDMFIMFWSLGVCFTHFNPNVLSHALHMHHICTPHAHLMHTLVHLSCFCISIMAVICHYIFITYNMIVCHCLCLFRAFVFVLWTNLVLIKFMFLFMCFCTCIFVFVSIFANVSL